jgi:hypothetical protein
MYKWDYHNLLEIIVSDKLLTKTKLENLQNYLILNINSLITTKKHNNTLINTELSCDKVIKIRNSSFTELQSILSDEELYSYIYYKFNFNVNTIDDDTNIQELLNNFKDIFLLEHDNYFDPSLIFYRSNWFRSTYGSALSYNKFINLSENNFPLENIEKNGIIRYNECVKIIHSETVSRIHSKKKLKKSKEGNLVEYKRIKVLHNKFDSIINVLNGALKRYNSQFQSEDEFDYSICVELINKDKTEHIDDKDLNKLYICNAINELKRFLENEIISDLQFNKIKALYNQPYGNMLVKSGLREMTEELQRKKINKGGSLEYYRLNWLFHLQGIFVVVASAFYSTITFE